MGLVSEHVVSSKRKLNKIQTLVKTACQLGFNEVQLDYIRFADKYLRIPLKTRYKFVAGILKNAKEITSKHNVKLSADVFGRIAFNRNDIIGQKLEIFAKYTDIIYPMLYPSHFLGDKRRMSNPGATVKEGTVKSIKRVKNFNVAIQPYIQAFKYKYRLAGVSYSDYIKKQIIAVEKTAARGWVAWNINCNYNSLFKAIREIK